MEYYVLVTELLEKVVKVDAESFNEAAQKVEDAYNNDEFELTADDHSTTLFQWGEKALWEHRTDLLKIKGMDEK